MFKSLLYSGMRVSRVAAGHLDSGLPGNLRMPSNVQQGMLALVGAGLEDMQLDAPVAFRVQVANCRGIRSQIPYP